MPHRKIGVLVGQTGTPAAPTPAAVRPYLRQFLGDRRVIDYNYFGWQLLLNGIILQTRPKRSARLYQRIWLKEGSPLLVYSQAQVAGLQERLGDQFRVILGMSYSEPTIEKAVATLEAEGIDQIIVLPMFPQYSSTTTAAIYDEVYRAAAGRTGAIGHQHKRFVPTLRFVRPYYDDPGYITALKTRLQQSIAQLEHEPDHYVISFHGIPRRYIETGDPYRQQCEHTAVLLAEAMSWQANEWSLSFQSRFGPEDWLEPYTEKVLEGLHVRGIKRPLVFSPGFVTDCLETLDELGNEGREQFESGGGHGEHFQLAPCLNDHPIWLDTLAAIVEREAMGWTTSDRVRAEG